MRNDHEMMLTLQITTHGKFISEHVSEQQSKLSALDTITLQERAKQVFFCVKRLLTEQKCSWAPV